MSKIITMLNGEQHDQDWLVQQAAEDDFYYGYLGKVAFSSSNIKKLLDSPRTYYNLMQYGDETNSQALRDGRLIHMMVLEPHKVNELVFADVSTKTTKTWKEMSAQYPSHILYTKKERQMAERLTEALLKNDQAVELLRDSVFEVGAVDTIEGYPFRAKADILKNNGTIIDLKTTSDLRNFVYSARHKYSYDVQVYIYCRLFNVDYTKFKFLVIDKLSCDVGVYTVSEDFYNKGEEKVMFALQQYHDFFEHRPLEEIQEMINNYTIQGEL
jgi:hypothetical protein